MQTKVLKDLLVESMKGCESMMNTHKESKKYNKK